MGSYLYTIQKSHPGAEIHNEPVYFSKYLCKPSTSGFRKEPAWITAQCALAASRYQNVKYFVQSEAKLADRVYDGDTFYTDAANYWLPIYARKDRGRIPASYIDDCLFNSSILETVGYLLPYKGHKSKIHFDVWALSQEEGDYVLRKHNSSVSYHHDTMGAIRERLCSMAVNMRNVGITLDTVKKNVKCEA